MPNCRDFSKDQLRRLLDDLTPDERAVLNYRWEFWARENEKLPPADWHGWLIIAGRGWGKTRTGAEAVRDEVESGRSTRIALVGETSADGRDVMVHGESGIIAISPPWATPKFTGSGGGGRPKLVWPNGAIATLYDAREPDQLRGPQHDFIWFDELAKYRYAEDVFDQAMFGLRLGTKPRWMATTTPRPISLIKRLCNQSGVIVTRGRTDENLENLAPTFRQSVVERYQGTRIGRQELDAEILEDVPGALWSRRALDESRVSQAPVLKRVVVAVDPAATSSESSNETGIIVIGLGENKHGYVLDDFSLRAPPDKWARAGVAAYRKYEADCLVAESNQGGEMVAMCIRAIADLPVTLVHATRGKYVRAEPISALYEQGRIHHVGTLPTLEDQMIAFTPERASDRSDGQSPDRVDALVWGCTELFPDLAPRIDRKKADVQKIGTIQPSPNGWMAS